MERVGLGEHLAHNTVALDITPERDRKGHCPLVVVRCQGHTAVLRLMPFVDHLGVDVLAFVNGERARTGVFGLEDGKRYELGRTPGTSHAFPATSLVSLLVGRQEVKP